MSGSGAPTPRDIDGRGLRVTVVASQWHERITDALVQGAERALAAAKVDATEVVRVPGAFELPIAVQALVKKRCDAVVALGVVIRGGTPHFDYVCRAVTDGLTRVALDAGVPVGFGVLTCDNEAQALDRCGIEGSSEDKGQEAAMAAVETALLLRRLRHDECHEEATGR